MNNPRFGWSNFKKIESNLEDGKENHGVNQLGKIKLDSVNLNMLAHAKPDLGDLGKKKVLSMI